MRFSEVSMGALFVIVGGKPSPLFRQEGGDAALVGKRGTDSAVGAYRVASIRGDYITDQHPSVIPPDTPVQLVRNYFV